jgi:chitinase
MDPAGRCAGFLVGPAPVMASEVIGYYPGWKHQSFPVASVDASS